jgi:hypothetical protein
MDRPRTSRRERVPGRWVVAGFLVAGAMFVAFAALLVRHLLRAS